MFLPDLDARQIKKAYYHTIHVYEEEQRIVRSESEGGGNREKSELEREPGNRRN